MVGTSNIEIGNSEGIVGVVGEGVGGEGNAAFLIVLSGAAEGVTVAVGVPLADIAMSTHITYENRIGTGDVAHEVSAGNTDLCRPDDGRATQGDHKSGERS